MKQIEKTPKITERLKGILGADGNVDNLAVYEVVALNTRPLRKKHPLYEGAVADIGLLSAMNDRVEQDPIPLQVMHQGGVLPVGKVFDGGIVTDNGVTEMRALMYVPKDQTDIINKLESAVVDEVSVGMLPAHILCSACGWDYLGADSTIDNIFTCTCANGHVLRENGVHAQLSGLDTWFELSLVGQGGAMGAKIVKPNQAKLAASGGADLLQVLTLSASPTKGTPMTDKTPVELGALVDQLVDAKTKLATAEASVAANKTEIDTLKAQVADLTAKLNEASKTDAAKVAADLVKVQAELKAAMDFIKDFAKRSLVAAGMPAEQLPETVEALVASINSSQNKLKAILPPPGGVGQSASTDGNDGVAPASLSAFKIKR